MSDKEKLEELLDDIQRDGNSFDDIERYGMRFPDTVSNEDVATHLIANGVTIQRWIPVTERLPEDGQDVLGFLQNDTERRIFPANYDHGIWFDCLFNIHIQSVTRWMPLPQPPKGE